MQGAYKNRKMSKKDTRIKVQMNHDQFAVLQTIAKRHNMSVEEVVKRYVLRLIADRAMP